MAGVFMGHSPYRPVDGVKRSADIFLVALSYLLTDYLWFAKFEILSV